MITVTIGEILTNRAAYHPGPVIYRARAGDLVLYVGKTIDSAADRILEHLGLQGRGGSALGRLITDNLPESKTWEVDILTLEDCRPNTLKYFPYYAKRLAEDAPAWEALQGLDLAEQALIFECGPCLNVTHNENNPNRQPLPAKYRRDDVIDMPAMLGLAEPED